jgi:phenylacetic acid degradation operon negative regulatory protein
VTTFTAAEQGGELLPAQPRALIVTIYGLYARESGGWLSVASLIRLMAAVGADEPAVRSSISRLKQRGILEPRRIGRAAGYALSQRGTEILAEGGRRIFERPRAQAGGGWLLAVFSVPERERRRRHELRSRLAWLGFGTVSAGVWIAPGHLAAETTDVLRRNDLASYVDLFHADYLAFGDLADLLGRWWDLDRLAMEYQAFSGAARALLDHWKVPSGGPAGGDVAGGAPVAGPPAAEPAGECAVRYGNTASNRGSTRPSGPDSERAAFADYVRVLTAWRRLPFLDPGLPAELLPEQWPGLAAAEAFAVLRGRLAGPARAHVLAITGPPG